MARVDLHVKVLDEEVIRRAERREIDVLVYAPHFTRYPSIVEKANRYSTDEVTVIPARELFAGPWWNRRHVLAIGLSDPVPDFLPLSVTIDELRNQGAAILIPHPTFLSVSLTADEVRSYRHAIDAIEVRNPKHLPSHNRNAKNLADELEIPGFSSSYAHLKRSIGVYWTTVEAPVETANQLCEAIRTGSIGGIGQHGGGRHLSTRFPEFMHLFWENSWEKFDRVIRSEQEPTHPTHPAYPDRFAEMSVY